MKKEYDFSHAEQGKFYRPIDELEIPIYLESEVSAFFQQLAARKNLALEKIVSSILRKEMELLRELA